MTNDRVRMRALQFAVNGKNSIVSSLWNSTLPTAEVIQIERQLCDVVYDFMDDAFPGWRDIDLAEKLVRRGKAKA